MEVESLLQSWTRLLA